MTAKGLSTDVSWNEKVRKALDGMLYLSESEAPLILLNVAAVEDLDGLQQFIAVDSGVAPEMQEIVSPKQFLNQIHWAADPNDPIVQEYANKFDKLFDVLKDGNGEMNVVRVNDPKQLIYIAAIRPQESVVIRTEAVET